VTRHQYGISALISQTSFCGKTSSGAAKCQLFSKLSCSTGIFAHDIFLSYSNVGGWRNQHLQPSKLKFWHCCHLTTNSFSLGRLLCKSTRQLQNFRRHGDQNGCNLEGWLTMQLEKLSETSRFTYDINRQVKWKFQVPQTLSHDSEACKTIESWKIYNFVRKASEPC